MFNNVNNELLRTISTSSSSSSSSVDELLSASAATSKTTSEITSDDIDRLCDGQNQAKEVTITQFAQRVLDFSSQYGSDYSISYTACNITGRPSKFPNYGDFPETFAMVSECRKVFKVISIDRLIEFGCIVSANVWQMVGYGAIQKH